MIGFCITAVAMAVAITVNMLFHMHMFQLNSYKPKEHMAWLKGNVRRIVGVELWYVVAALLFCLWIPGKIIGSLLLLLVAYLQRPRKAKKPLVFTKRVNRMFVTTAIVFIAAFVGLFFLRDSAFYPLAAGVVLVVSPLVILLANFLNKPVEKYVTNWFINDAKRILNENSQLTVIGVTGSFGKTSVKFYLQKLLQAEYNVLVTPLNYNTTLGVVRTIRENLKPTHEVFVCEMGAKNVGDIKEICDLVHPKHGVITSIGPQHLESFGSIDNVIKTKFELSDAVGDDGFVFLNLDNEYIEKQSAKNNRNNVTYGSQNKNALYRAYDIKATAKGSEFKMDIDGVTKEFKTSLIGMHNVQNVAGAIAVAHKLGVPVDKIVRQVRALEGVEHRLQLRKSAACTIIDDAYNSNPTGAKAALDTLAMFDGAKIIVTPGMVELGAKQYEENKIFGMEIAGVCDFVALVGESQTKPIQDGLKEAGYPASQLFIASDFNEAMTRVYNWNSEGREKIVLLENDLPDNY